MNTSDDGTFRPGRYYLALGYCDIPAGRQHPNGGNILFHFWRNDTEPGLWRVRWRFRYYATLDDAFDDKDEKNFYGASFPGNQPFAESLVTKFCETIADATGLFFGRRPEPEVIWIRGNSDEALSAIVRANKPWMHMKIQPVDTPPP